MLPTQRRRARIWTISLDVREHQRAAMALGDQPRVANPGFANPTRLDDVPCNFRLGNTGGGRLDGRVEQGGRHLPGRTADLGRLGLAAHQPAHAAMSAWGTASAYQRQGVVTYVHPWP